MSCGPMIGLRLSVSLCPWSVIFPSPSHLFPHVDGTGWLAGPGGGYFFPPVQLGADETLMG